MVCLSFLDVLGTVPSSLRVVLTSFEHRVTDIKNLTTDYEPSVKYKSNKVPTHSSIPVKMLFEHVRLSVVEVRQVGTQRSIGEVFDRITSALNRSATLQNGPRMDPGVNAHTRAFAPAGAVAEPLSHAVAVGAAA